MAGTLVITTLSDGTNSTSATNCIQGSAKAWVNFDGTGTPTIRASYNVTNVTKVATGSYTVNFTTAMPDANYSTVGSTFDNGVVVLSTTTTSSINIATRIIQTSSFPVGQPTDYSTVCVCIFR
jgi:hypothetical protein